MIFLNPLLCNFLAVCNSFISELYNEMEYKCCNYTEMLKISSDLTQRQTQNDCKMKDSVAQKPINMNKTNTRGRKINDT